MGRGPAQPIKVREDGPRPGPAHHFFRGWASARPAPSNLQRMGRGPARPINFSDNGSRPGPTHHFFNFSRSGPSKSLGLARHIFKFSARPGPDKRRMTSTVCFHPAPDKGRYCRRIFCPKVQHVPDMFSCFYMFCCFSCFFRFCFPKRGHICVPELRPLLNFMISFFCNMYA